MRIRTLAAIALLLAQSPAVGAEKLVPPNQFRTLSFGIGGGFQTWGLSGLESTLLDRAQRFALDGYALGPADFGPTYSYTGVVEFRLTEAAFLRTQVEWTRLRWEDRDRKALARLGGISRTQISYTAESQVRTRPLLWIFGAGLSRELDAFRVALSGNFVVAPLELRETVTLSVLTSDTETELLSRGTGTGFELNLAVDAFTEVRTTLFLETFWRRGSAGVELQERSFESSTFPLKRRIDFDGMGIRGGFRWI